jgi:hypothetical protein
VLDNPFLIVVSLLFGKWDLTGALEAERKKISKK